MQNKIKIKMCDIERRSKRQREIYVNFSLVLDILFLHFICACYVTCDRSDGENLYDTLRNDDIQELKPIKFC